MPAERKKVLGLTIAQIVALAVIVPGAVVLISMAKPFITHVLDKILHLPPGLVYVVVGLLVFAEAAVFFGFVFPGETAVILGGVVASGGHVNIVALCALVVVCAIVGDSVGYWVGHRWGSQVLASKLLASRQGGIDRAFALLRRRGGTAVFLGRFTAFLRAVMPGLAGASKMHYRTFFVANAIGGVVWGITFTLAGYFLGSAYARAEKYAGWVSQGLLILILLIGTGLFIRGRMKEQRIEEAFEHEVVDPKLALEEDLEQAQHDLDG